jgi:hypothetical protein
VVARTSRFRARELLKVLAFGLGVAILYRVVLLPPPALRAYLLANLYANVGMTLAAAALAAFFCRGVVQALLRLVGF